MSVKSICGVILMSDDPERLARFYGEVLGAAFAREDHGELDPHFGLDIGTIHFGIHPPSNFRKTSPGNANVSIAFHVESLAAPMARLERLGAAQVEGPHDEGFGPVTSWLDPDGNVFELVELRYDFAGSDEA